MVSAPSSGQPDFDGIEASAPDTVFDMITAISPVAAVYGAAVLESLGSRTADAVTAKARRFRVRKRWFRRRRPHHTVDALLEVDGCAALLVTDDLPDEARLAVLDLDLAEDSVRGKVLGWDPEQARWIPVNPPAPHDEVQRRRPRR
ncbi:hypothetical protein [Nocardia gipuzkoensis]|uniref:hypothetical protein n=1 Tax=Nocardia gipuzkoensis TaxID=2749991 RepID=UPI00237D79AA|nr:hypothetical protein [Nocardia gipuzkoensis]MDE1675188.1 hypothetical protein [Nocardia gipuzkoensis]